TVPFGVDPDEYADDGPSSNSAPVFFHLGSMDWLPNEEGIRWLLDNVWPKVLKKRPKARLNLAGNKMPQDLMNRELEGVSIKGRVKNAIAYMKNRQVMVVPLFSAGGMRVKIIEGMAMGKAIISTPIGAEGIAHTDGKNILLARNMTEFAEHIIALHDDPSLVADLGANARKLVRTSYSDGPIVQELVAFYKRLLKA
ncbi:MAG TPA: glycosyltransferase family 4 protein, partial [Flavobacteriales bacterium]|nr:glycosyltransferase family 4 protein [Flavobacteriales bacterium]